MAIPTVPGSEIDFSTPQRAVHLNAGAITAPARARMSAVGSRFRSEQQVSSAIGGAGEAIGGIADDLLKANRARVAADADFKMRAAQQSFVESLRGDEHEDGWTERARGVYDKVRDDVLASGVPPGMRQELDQQLRGWGQSLQTRAQTLASVQSVNRAEVSIRKSYEEAGRDGDGVGMANAVRLGRSSKLDPVAMDELESNIPRALALTAIEQGLRTNPQGTHDLLASGASLPIADQNGKPIVPSRVFPQKEFQSLINAARIQSAAWQKTNAEDLLQTAADPITGMVPDEVIRQKMEKKEISEQFGRSLMASQDRKAKAQTAEDSRAAAKADRDAYNLVGARAHDVTAWGVAPDEYSRTLIADAADISDPALRQRAVNDINHQLEAVKKTGELAARPTEAAMYALMKRDLAEQSAMVPIAVADVPAKSHLLSKDEPATTTFTPIRGGLTALRKMDDVLVESTFGKGTRKEDIVRAAEVHSAKLEAQMREWFKTPDGEKATFEQADSHRRELEAPYVMDAVKATLSKRAPAVITSREEFMDLPSGATFVWNGRIGTKK